MIQINPGLQNTPLPQSMASLSRAPREEYEARLAARQTELARRARQEKTIGNWRLVVFASGLLIAWLSFHDGLFSPWLLLVPFVLFLALASHHDRVIQNRKRAERAVAFYIDGLRRMDNRWQGLGNGGTRFLSVEHPYAVDLDIFGRASLFELLCTARTRTGEECLADWLRAPSALAAVRERQQAVQELRERLDLREDLAILGERAKGTIRPEALTPWGRQPSANFTRFERALIIALVAAVLIAAGAWLSGYGLLPFAALLAAQQSFVARLRPRIKQVVGSVEQPGRDLATLALLLARIEPEPCQSLRLTHLQTLLHGNFLPSSVRIARLQRLLELLEIPHNPLLGVLDRIVQLTTFCAFAIETWRNENGPYLTDWIQVVGEFEALCALAGYAYEHPDDTFPEIVAEGLCLEAQELAHPLLSSASAIRNDLQFSPEHRLYVVSGSNMSGKSTLLRALGVNVVLALAGAPVRARLLRLSPLRIGASIRTQDSLEAGISRFYAEILRLRQIVDMSGAAPPLLFLLDEILHGTNSHDRFQGAEAILRALNRRDAIGLVTTHDLALARIADDAALCAANVHFEDQLQDGKMTFDYRLRPGVVTKSNAIELMRAVGLEV